MHGPPLYVLTEFSRISEEIKPMVLNESQPDLSDGSGRLWNFAGREFAESRVELKKKRDCNDFSPDWELDARSGRFFLTLLIALVGNGFDEHLLLFKYSEPRSNTRR
jgi:hypothetical protein